MGVSRLAKRTIDIGVAAVLLALLSPLLLAVAAYIKWRSPGPVLFFQTRVGKGEKPFQVWKFRTMHVALKNADRSTVSLQNDQRVYAGANILRKLKIDELPQLVNVLFGDMSLVGPRPTVASDYERMSDLQRQRANVPPGITGLAQIRGNTALSWPERIELDLQYIESWSLWRDFAILFETAWQVLSVRAETHPPGEDEWSKAA